MKKTVLGLAFLLYSLGAFSQNDPKVLTRLITYWTDIRGYRQSDSLIAASQLQEILEPNWYERNIFSADRKAFVKTVHDSACSGHLTVYESYEIVGDQPVFNRLPLNNVRSLLNDTMLSINTYPYPPYGDFTITEITVFDIMTKVDALQFMERWTYSPETFTFHKEVIAFALCTGKYDDNGIFQGYKTLYWVRCGN